MNPPSPEHAAEPAPSTSGRRASPWLRASPAELVGLSILLAGSVLAGALLWIQATQRPSDPPVPPPVPGAGQPAASSPPAVDLPEVPADGSASASGNEGEQRLTVHVSGAVVAPGVVHLPPGARVADALDAAGGMATDALGDEVNLARELRDGEQVHLRREGEPPRAGVGAAPAVGGRTPPPIDLNTAPAARLETLPGIGPSRAAAIIRYRDEHGPFQAPGDLRQIPGIGEATFQGLAELVIVP